MTIKTTILLLIISVTTGIAYSSPFPNQNYSIYDQALSLKFVPTNIPDSDTINIYEIYPDYPYPYGAGLKAVSGSATLEYNTTYFTKYQNTIWSDGGFYYEDGTGPSSAPYSLSANFHFILNDGTEFTATTFCAAFQSALTINESGIIFNYTNLSFIESEPLLTILGNLNSVDNPGEVAVSIWNRIYSATGTWLITDGNVPIPEPKSFVLFTANIVGLLFILLKRQYL